jgi:YggT family protein
MGLVCGALSVALLIVVARSLLSLLPGASSSAAGRLLERVTEPVFGPVRRVLPPMRVGGGALDLAPLVVGLGIIVLQQLVC